MKKWIAIVFGLSVFWLVKQWPSERLKVVFCDVGQGDALLVIWKQVQIVIDGGPTEEGVLSCLGRNMPFWDREIELVVSTHPDQDHIGGLPDILERYTVGRVLSNGMEGLGDDYRRFKRLVDDEYHPKTGERIKVGELEFKVLWPREGYEGETNERGIVLELSYGRFNALFMADISEKQEEEMLGELEDIEVLKVAHHGSKYSSSEEFLKSVRPELAIIEVGKDNRYGHPTREVLDRLGVLGIRVLRTDIDREVVVVSDGKKWWVEGMK